MDMLRAAKLLVSLSLGVTLLVAIFRRCCYSTWRGSSCLGTMKLCDIYYNDVVDNMLWYLGGCTE